MANTQRSTVLCISDSDVSSQKAGIWRRIFNAAGRAAKYAARHLLLPLIAGALAYVLIPITLSRYNDAKALREARLTRAIKFADRDEDFRSKLHSEFTLLNMFVSHNNRMKIHGTDLKKARSDLHDNYTKRYLDIDATEWWWPGDFEKEIRALNLLSRDEENQLKAYLQEYSYSAKLAIYQPIHLWHFLDSSKYRVGQRRSNDEITRIQGCVQDIFAEEDSARTNLVQSIVALFAHSDFRSDWSHIIGPPQKEPTFQP